MTCLAYCGYRSGASGVRSVASAAEAEKILTGGYGVTTVTLKTQTGEIIGSRQSCDYSDDCRVRWIWSYDPELLAEALRGTS